jgi:hypothetical protein
MSSKEDETEAEKAVCFANEKLLAARSYILFTVEGKDGNTTFNFDPHKLNDIEMLGFLTIAINTLEHIKHHVEIDTDLSNDCDDCDGCDEENDE